MANLLAESMVELVSRWATEKNGRPIRFSADNIRRNPNLVTEALKWHRKKTIRLRKESSGSILSIFN